MDHVQKNLEASEAELTALGSLAEMYEAQVAVVDTQIDKCTTYAPIDGVIGKRWHFPGDVVREGQTVFSLFDLTQIWITANLEETKVSSVHDNDPVFIKIDAYQQFDFEGNVSVIGAGSASQYSLIPPNNASGNFTKVTQRVPLKIVLKTPYPGGTLYLRPGMSAEVKIKAR
jgi:membrane fusion protein (multidrug efflux system)